VGGQVFVYFHGVFKHVIIVNTSHTPQQDRVSHSRRSVAKSMLSDETKKRAFEEQWTEAMSLCRTFLALYVFALVCTCYALLVSYALFLRFFFVAL
jgi:hypothetical protein